MSSLLGSTLLSCLHGGRQSLLQVTTSRCDLSFLLMRPLMRTVGCKKLSATGCSCSAYSLTRLKGGSRSCLCGLKALTPTLPLLDLPAACLRSAGSYCILVGCANLAECLLISGNLTCCAMGATAGELARTVAADTAAAVLTGAVQLSASWVRAVSRSEAEAAGSTPCDLHTDAAQH